ncbi:polysaccharide deacetylase [Niveomyces insectorum RCEF 264]|uniref:chitin deacetylase n=1 Tax=Niveomyces insectorum RCEF 264 TaxID=1081102 RepID=A0A167WXX6_9HYPO|nr:polysaccharide deacetylase [Niveomyces insectorum RCEF 264]
MLRFPRLLRLPSKLRRRARRQRMATLLVLLALVALLLLPFYVVYKPPALLIRYFAWRWPDVLWRVDLPPPPPPPPPPAKQGPKLVALTIDDAPSEHTAAILQVLREYGAQATLFVIGGQVAGREDVLRAAIGPNGGHELANHGMHDEAARALADGVLADQIQTVDGLLQRIYKDASSSSMRQPPHYFRPGSGFFSDRMRALVSRLGYRLVLGNVYPHDAQINSPWANARHILSMLQPGAIVICHDRRSWTAPMLRTMLPAAIARGYKFVTLTELLAASKP